MHDACMSTKTISVKIEAYERLRRARRSPEESFSQVIMRATWAERAISASELLALGRSRGPVFSEDELDRIEDLQKRDEAPADKWAAG